MQGQGMRAGASPQAAEAEGNNREWSLDEIPADDSDSSRERPRRLVNLPSFCPQVVYQCRMAYSTQISDFGILAGLALSPCLPVSLSLCLPVSLPVSLSPCLPVSLSLPPRPPL